MSGNTIWKSKKEERKITALFDLFAVFQLHHLEHTLPYPQKQFVLAIRGIIDGARHDPPFRRELFDDEVAKTLEENPVWLRALRRQAKELAALPQEKQDRVDPPIKRLLVLDYNVVEDLVQRHLGIKDYNCVAEEEWRNDSSYTFDVDLSDYSEQDRADLKEILAGDSSPSYSLRIFLLELAERKIIPEGDYLIEVCW